MVRATHSQTFIGIWFHDNRCSEEQQNKMQVQLNRTFYYYRIFTNPSEFSEYINQEKLVTKVFLIVSISDFSLFSYVQLALNSPNFFEKVYIFLPMRIETRLCYNTTNIDELFTQISNDISIYMNLPDDAENDTNAQPRPIIDVSINEAPPSFSVFNSVMQQATLIRHLTRESMKFVSFLILRKILTERSYNNDELTEMCATCRDHIQDPYELQKVDQLEGTYNPNDAVEYYTRSSFLFPIINRVCGTENMEEIYKFRIYISDLHRKLCGMNIEQTEDILSAIENLYRGKLLSGSVLQQLNDNQGGLISINGFLSTTVDRDVAMVYAGNRENNDPSVKGTLFVLNIQNNIGQPYAYIAMDSNMRHEDEVLFSLGTIWRIESIRHEQNLCTIQLVSCGEQELALPSIYENYINNDVTWITLGDILLHSGNQDEAKWCYRTMLRQQPNNDRTIGILHYKIGMIQFQKKQYDEALQSLIRAESLLRQPTNNSNDIPAPRPIYMHHTENPLPKIYTNIGIMLEKNGRYREAVTNYERALEHQSSVLEKATINNNLGLVCFRLGRYQPAKEHHEQACTLVGENHLWWQEFNNNLNRAQRQLDHIASREEPRPNNPVNVLPIENTVA